MLRKLAGTGAPLIVHKKAVQYQDLVCIMIHESKEVKPTLRSDGVLGVQNEYTRNGV